MSAVKSALILAFLSISIAFGANIAESHQQVKLVKKNPAKAAFANFVNQHNKSYAQFSDEYHYRSAIFRDNLARIEKLNSRGQTSELGNAKYGINLFADMTQEEFRRMKGGLKFNGTEHPSLKNGELNFDELWAELLKETNLTEEQILSTLPFRFDWRDYGAVTDVKDQGECSSCWSFSSTGSIEGQYKIRRNEQVSLSEQELVDCDKNDGGCDGGHMVTAFADVVESGGLVSEKDYPYEAEQKVCRLNKEAKKYPIDGFVSLPADENKLIIWLYKRGPISIAINADFLQSYSHGILYEDAITCPNKVENLWHAVLIVGFGEELYKDLVIPYWIVKNNYTDKWGEKGYFRVARGENVCGLATLASSAVLFK